jgi:hypothetical protein
MADGIHGGFGANARCNTSRRDEYDVQEPGDEGDPDIKRPPDSDIPEFENDRPEAPSGPGAPPPERTSKTSGVRARATRRSCELRKAGRSRMSHTRTARPLGNAPLSGLSPCTPR